MRLTSLPECSFINSWHSNLMLVCWASVGSVLLSEALIVICEHLFVDNGHHVLVYQLWCSKI